MKKFKFNNYEKQYINLYFILFYFSMGVYSQVKKSPMQRIKENTEMIESKTLPGTYEVLYLDRGNAKSELKDYRGVYWSMKKHCP